MNKKTKYISSIFITSILATSVVLAWTNLPTVSQNSDLTSTIWNNLVGKINENGAKLDGISNVGGKIGIGTTNPQRKLHVYGLYGTNDYGDGLATQFETTSAGNSSWLEFTGNGMNSQIGGYLVDSNKSGLYFSTKGSGGVQRQMVITEDGNVGIGTTSPDSLLHVNGLLHLQAIDGTTVPNCTAALLGTIYMDTSGQICACVYDQGTSSYKYLGMTSTARICSAN